MDLGFNRKPLITNPDLSESAIRRRLGRLKWSHDRINNYIKGWRQPAKKK